MKTKSGFGPIAYWLTQILVQHYVSMSVSMCLYVCVLGHKHTNKSGATKDLCDSGDESTAQSNKVNQNILYINIYIYIFRRISIKSEWMRLHLNRMSINGPIVSQLLSFWRFYLSSELDSKLNLLAPESQRQTSNTDINESTSEHWNRRVS